MQPSSPEWEQTSTPRGLWWKRLHRLRTPTESESHVGTPFEPSFSRSSSSQGRSRSALGTRQKVQASPTPQRPSSSPATVVGQSVPRWFGKRVELQSPSEASTSTPKWRPCTSASNTPPANAEVEAFCHSTTPEFSASQVGYKTRCWKQTYADLMEAYWSMDLGALLEGGPMSRRKSLQALFRGRLVMALRLAEALRLQSRPVESDENPAALQATSQTPDSESADSVLATRSLDAETMLAAARTEPLNAEPELSLFHPTRRQQISLHRVTNALRDRLADNVLRDRLMEKATRHVSVGDARGEHDKATTYQEAGCSKQLIVPSSPLQPRKKPRPLSKLRVPGRHLWYQTYDGCFIEMPADPIKAKLMELGDDDSDIRKRIMSSAASSRPRASLVPPSKRQSTEQSRLFAFDVFRSERQRRQRADEEESVNGSQKLKILTDKLGFGIDAFEPLRSSLRCSIGGESMEEAMSVPGSPCQVDARQKNGKPMRGEDMTVASPRKAGSSAKEKQESEFRNLVGLSRKHDIPLAELQDLYGKFCSYDSQSSGYLSHEEFTSLIRDVCNLPKDSDIPFNLLDAARFINIESDGVVSFDEYVLWTIHCAYSEEMMVPDLGERYIRQLARERNMLLPDVEKIKALFDSYDENGSGEIEESEFRLILFQIMGVKKEADVSEKRLHRYWKELDPLGKGAIEFGSFLAWCCNTGFASLATRGTAKNRSRNVA